MLLGLGENMSIKRASWIQSWATINILRDVKSTWSRTLTSFKKGLQNAQEQDVTDVTLTQQRLQGRPAWKRESRPENQKRPGTDQGELILKLAHMELGAGNTPAGHCSTIWHFLATAAPIEWSAVRLHEQREVIKTKLALDEVTFENFCLELAQPESPAYFRVDSPIYTAEQKRALSLAQALKRLQREY